MIGIKKSIHGGDSFAFKRGPFFHFRHVLLTMLAELWEAQKREPIDSKTMYRVRLEIERVEPTTADEDGTYRVPELNR